MKEAFFNLLDKSKELWCSFFAVVCAFLAPISSLLIIVGGAIIIDTCMGIWKSKKNKVEITSRKLSAIISKMFIYQGAVITFYFIDIKLLGEFVLLLTDIHLFLTKVTAIVLLGIELLSINENFKAIFKISIWEKIKILIQRTKEIKEEIGSLKK